MSGVTDPKSGLISIAARLALCKSLDRLNEVCENQKTISTDKLQLLINDVETKLKREAICVRNMAMAIQSPKAHNCSDKINIGGFCVDCGASVA